MSDDITKRRTDLLRWALWDGREERQRELERQAYEARCRAVREAEEAEKRRQAERTEAERWVEEDLPRLVKKAAADGDTWVHIDRSCSIDSHRTSSRAALLRELGYTLREENRTGWEYDWVMDLDQLGRSAST